MIRFMRRGMVVCVAYVSPSVSISVAGRIDDRRKTKNKKDRLRTFFLFFFFFPLLSSIL